MEPIIEDQFKGALIATYPNLPKLRVGIKVKTRVMQIQAIKFS
ncbi:hypothetical protein SAMN05444359_1252 [Neolewinella agarilytica]|uniref:Uncharacterized protein n=1 Tax=Neolewinella agarilytica TaxID=478744 RepID=A0A1H9LP42_9BACT|nr:hypothetical protein SAMN05444359_1252 [Neolewinella agarilytica]